MPIDRDRLFEDYCLSCNDVLLQNPSSNGLEPAIEEVKTHTEQLVTAWSMPHPEYLRCQPDAMYGSYLLYLNDSKDFCVALDVFMPGQAAWIHNHLCWCMFVCMDGSERERLYTVDPELSAPPVQTVERVCPVGEVRTLGADRNLFHQVECASPTEPTVSLHIYGSDIGTIERDMWDHETERFVKFRSGYSNEAAGLPTYVRC